MAMRVIQYRETDGARKIGLVSEDGDHVHVIQGTASVYALAQEAIGQGGGLAALARTRAGTERVDYLALLQEGRVLTPLDHPEPARFWVTGTGLTHIGSAAARNKMHEVTHGDAAPLSDSMKIFRIGIEGGKPGGGKIGVQPEWFFKGVGTCVVPPGAALPRPGFAKAGGEEPEIVGLYIIDEKGEPWRIGFALGNEFSDHVTEAENYLYLAHSKLRSCAIGPELLLGDLPQDLRGKTRIRRNGKILWEADFLSGEKNMCHSIANLEHHHFRYPMFRRPGDLHAHFFGAAELSYLAGIRTEPGDEFEIDVPAMGKPLRNRMEPALDRGLVTVEAL
jgi:hypothetical protein